MAKHWDSFLSYCIITIAPSKGVSQDQNTLSKGSTEPTNDISASNLKAIPEQELPTTLKPTPTVETQHQPIQLHCSECATWPTWIKAMSNLQKAAEDKQKADNKALCEACTKCRELKAKAKLQPSIVEESHSRPPDSVTPITELEIANFAYIATHGLITPISYKEAVHSPESTEWNKAMKEEIDNHTQWRTWELVPLPKGQKAIGSRWTYVSSAGNLRRELRELRMSSPDLQDVGRDFGFSLCAAPLSDSCPKISERRDRRSEIERLE